MKWPKEYLTHVHSFNKTLSQTRYLPGKVIRNGDAEVTNNTGSTLREPTVFGCKLKSRQVFKIRSIKVSAQ